MPKANRTVSVDFDRTHFNEVCEKTIGTLDSYAVEKNSNGFTIKENKVNLKNGTYPVTAEVIFNNGSVTIDAKCGGIGPIQSKHVNQVVDIIERNIKKGKIVSADEIDDDVVRCPMCGGTQIQLQKRGWNAGTGFLGSGKNERVCMKCMHKF